MAKPSDGEPPVDDFASTSRDREAVSFDEPPAPPPSAPAADDGEPMWAGTLPRAAVVPVPIAEAPAPSPAAPAPAPPPPPAPPPDDPLDLAETSHRKPTVPSKEEAPLDQLAEDRRILAAGRAAGWKPGEKAEEQDRALRVGLWVVVALVALVVVGLCGGLGWSLLDTPIEVESDEAP